MNVGYNFYREEHLVKVQGTGTVGRNMSQNGSNAEGVDTPRTCQVKCVIPAKLDLRRTVHNQDTFKRQGADRRDQCFAD